MSPDASRLREDDEEIFPDQRADEARREQQLPSDNRNATDPQQDQSRLRASTQAALQKEELPNRQFSAAILELDGTWRRVPESSQTHEYLSASIQAKSGERVEKATVFASNSSIRNSCKVLVSSSHMRNEARFKLLDSDLS